MDKLVEEWMRQALRCESSIDTYARGWRYWCEWRGSDWKSQRTTKRENIERYCQWLLKSNGYAERYAKVLRSVVRSWFTFLKEDKGMIDSHPWSRRAERQFRVDEEKVTRGRGVREALTLDEATELLRWAVQEARPNQAVAIAWMTLCGLRSFEVAGVQLRQVMRQEDGTYRIVVCGKGRKTAVVQMAHPVAIHAWERYLDIRGTSGVPAILGGGGGPRSGAVTARTVQRWAKEGLEAISKWWLASHDLRKTAATLQGETGEDIHRIQKMLRHSRIQETLRAYVVRGLGLRNMIPVELRNVAKPEVLSLQPTLVPAAEICVGCTKESEPVAAQALKKPLTGHNETRNGTPKQPAWINEG